MEGDDVGDVLFFVIKLEANQFLGRIETPDADADSDAEADSDISQHPILSNLNSGTKKLSQLPGTSQWLIFHNIQFYPI